METSLDTTRDNAEPLPEIGHEATRVSFWQRTLTTNTMIVAVLAVVALAPRIVLATQLDLVTDEVVYILGGKIYLPLLEHLSVGASGWMYNYEHPPLVKFLIGLSITLNAELGHLLGELLAARLPSIIAGTLLVVAVYLLGREPFGRVVALLAALCLAVSPWLVYFSALAYLDMTMTALITVAYLLLWYALRRPWLYLIIALLVGLGADSKYTSVLAIPGMVLFTLYYFLAVRPRLPIELRPTVPWKWWLAAIMLAPLVFLMSDPAIWPGPYSLLIHSFRFEWEHSINGHLTFLAGQNYWHVPHWAILYILIVKISAFVTIPAAFFAIFALVQLARFHLHTPSVQVEEAASIAFLLVWLFAILGMFSLLNIVVGTHYHLPMAPPVALAGAYGLAKLLRYRRGQLLIAPVKAADSAHPASPATPAWRLNPRAAITVGVLALMLVGPHLFGLITVHDAEGYTSESFQGNENASLQVAYPGYRDALLWLAAHNAGQAARVGLVALPGTLGAGSDDVSWYAYNRDMTARFQLTEAHPGDKIYPYDYLVWPMHLVQRGYSIPEPWRTHVVHIVMGGNTIYCYILASSSTISDKNGT